MSVTQRTARLDRMELKLQQRLEMPAAAVGGIPVVAISACGCPGCGAPKASYDHRGDALVIRLGCEHEVPPPMVVPLDEAEQQEVAHTVVPPVDFTPGEGLGERRVSSLVQLVRSQYA
jgi:hypothetical protein